MRSKPLALSLFIAAVGTAACGTQPEPVAALQEHPCGGTLTMVECIVKFTIPSMGGPSGILFGGNPPRLVIKK